MIKSTVTENTKKGFNFPKLMINKNSGEIVLMKDLLDENRGIGVMLTHETNDSLTGNYYETNWNMSFFEDFQHQLILKNEEQ